jgi:hypothetical protein
MGLYKPFALLQLKSGNNKQRFIAPHPVDLPKAMYQANQANL